MQRSSEGGRVGALVLLETGHAHEDVVRVWVVAGPIAVFHHGPVTHECVHCGRHLEGREGRERGERKKEGGEGRNRKLWEVGGHDEVIFIFLICDFRLTA